MPIAAPGSLPDDALPQGQSSSVGVSPPSFTERFGADWDAFARLRALNAQANNKADFVDDKLDEYYQKTGERLPNPVRSESAAELAPEVDLAGMEKANRDKFAAAGMVYPSADEIEQGGIAKARAAVQK